MVTTGWDWQNILNLQPVHSLLYGITETNYQLTIACMNVFSYAFVSADMHLEDGLSQDNHGIDAVFAIR